MSRPRRLAIVRWLLGAIAVTHLAVPLLMLAWRDRLAAEIALAHPELSTPQKLAALDTALRAAFVFHALLLVLCIVLIVALGRGKRWAVRLAIVSQLLAILFSVVSWRASALFHFLIPAVDLAQLAVIVLLLADWRAHRRA